MCDVEANTTLSPTFRDALVSNGLLLPLGVEGVYGRSGVFEGIVEGVERLITQEAGDEPTEVLRFPPVFSRAHYSRINHIHNFPDLLGSVHTFTGNERDHRAMVGRFEAGEPWTDDLVPSELMLIPAACYPLYPTATGQLGAEGRMVDLRSFVFRHEPSPEPTRMQMFRQREMVRLGTAEQALAHRDAWLERGGALLRSMGLPVEAVVANDPFFGRGGRMSKASQREQTLKFELVVQVNDTGGPTAISSTNLHLDYFGKAFDIIGPDGVPASTACIGFGLERVTLALLRHHGLDTTHWPHELRHRLGIHGGNA